MGLISCESDDDGTSEIVEPIALTSGSADFSTYVALGNSLTAGYTDGALFPASQENSMTKMLSLKFSLAGGGGFTQPLMNDNFGGLLVGGNQILENRLVFNGTAPVRLEALVGPVTPTTDLLVNNPTGPFNNMGVPGAKSFHLLFDGYGNLGNLQAGMSNPYFIRMASAPNATVLGDAMAQAPTFFTLWIGNNDILGYATTGGDGTNPITDQQTFDFAYNTLITTLTSGGAKGVVANIPNVSAIPHFTTVPHNPVPLDEATAAAVNNAYAPYNGGLQTAVAALAGTGLFSAEEAAQRTIVFQAGPNNAVVIEDETLTDLGAINPAFAGLPKYRQATENDLLVLPASSFIGTLADPNNPLTVNGVAIPLADKWVLLPSEQQDIATATASFNATIAAAATAAGLAQVDANSLLDELAGGGIQSGNFTLTSSLVTGGAFSLDGIHPTSRGYALIANEFLKAIDATYGSNFEASGNLNDVGTFPTNYSVMLP
tara:strand:+ start:96442 stop:97905 length:1464 start_codon:yes stop_codon:yes gene_type:complete